MSETDVAGAPDLSVEVMRRVVRQLSEEEDTLGAALEVRRPSGI